MTLGPALEWMLRHPGQELVDQRLAKYRWFDSGFSFQVQPPQSTCCALWFNLLITPKILRMTFEVPNV